MCKKIRLFFGVFEDTTISFCPKYHISYIFKLTTLFSLQHSWRELKDLLAVWGTWGPSPYPRPSFRGIRPSTIRLARPQKTSGGSEAPEGPRGLLEPSKAVPTRLVGCMMMLIFFSFSQKVHLETKKKSWDKKMNTHRLEYNNEIIREKFVTVGVYHQKIAW